MIGHAGAAFVEKEQATQRRESTQELRLGGIFPDELHVVGKARHIDQIERTFAQHLEGDMYIATTRVLGPRRPDDSKSPPSAPGTPPQVVSGRCVESGSLYGVGRMSTGSALDVHAAPDRWPRSIPLEIIEPA